VPPPAALLLRHPSAPPMDRNRVPAPGASQWSSVKAEPPATPALLRVLEDAPPSSRLGELPQLTGAPPLLAAADDSSAGTERQGALSLEAMLEAPAPPPTVDALMLLPPSEEPPPPLSVARLTPDLGTVLESPPPTRSLE
jgi:hypothetical protein